MSEKNVIAFKRERQKIMCEEKIERLKSELATQKLMLFALEHPEEYERN